MKQDKLSPGEKHALMAHSLHGTALRWLYRILAPSHPRGWLDFHALYDPANPAVFSTIHCHGMERWNLPNIEMVDVPRDLGGYAHGIMFAICGYLKSTKQVKADETMGGMFVSNAQIVPHRCQFRAARIEDEPVNKNFLRIVDLGEAGGFPRKLFAAHLLALAENTGSVLKKVEILKRSVEIHPGVPEPGLAEESAAIENPGNFFSWYSLGDALMDAGEEAEGLKHLHQAVKQWPFGGRNNARVIVENIRNGHLPPPEKDARSRFWSEVADSWQAGAAPVRPASDPR
ncbi:MAG TPA: hypothetical protein VG734_14360 [Lacunisphaera sp.]|nr:hypothetical protein [Lacunisphaera sp.]